MSAARLAVLLTALALGACAGGGEPSLVRNLAPVAPPEPVGAPAPPPADPSAAIRAYQAYLEVAPESDPLRPRALQRLADLRQSLLESRDAAAPGEATALPPSAAERGEVAAMYRALLAEHPEHPDNAEVWYQLARAEESRGNAAAALQALSTLAQDYPDSPRIDEVHFRRGEFLFVLRRFDAAAEAYALVLAAGQGSQFYEPALYKRGWAQFRLGRHDAALDSFGELLDLHLGSGAEALGALPPVQQQRLRDTLEVMALDFSARKGPASVQRHFRRVGPRPYENLVYAQLGEQYLAKQRYTDAAGAFRAYVERYPLAADAPGYLLRAVEAYRAGGFSGQEREGNREFVRRYGLDQPYWRQHRPEAAPQLLAELEARIDALARYHHARVQASRIEGDGPKARAARAAAGADAAAAIDWYRKRIAYFPGSTATAAANFLLAELLQERGQFAAAVSEYERSAYDYPAHAKAAEAGYAAVLAYADAGRALQGEALAAWRARSLAAAQRFAAAFPDHPQAPKVLTRVAQDLLAGGDSRGAESAAERLLERYPEAPAELRRGAHLVLGQAAFDAGQFAGAEARYLLALALAPAAHPQLEQWRERLAVSVYRQGERARQAARLDEAAGHFLRVARLAPASGVRVNADFDAAAVLLQAGQWRRAAGVLEDFRGRFPKHALRLQADRELAVAYLQDGQPARAAAAFAVVSKSNPDPELRRAAAWQTAELYQKSGDQGAAVKAWSTYVRNYPRPLDAAIDARARLVGLFAEAGDGKSKRRWQRALIAADAEAGRERTEHSRQLAAAAQLDLAEAELHGFARVRLVAPLRRNLQRKREAMQRATEALGRAADYRVAAVTTAATFHTAELYHQFGRALMESERPKDLDEDALEEYELLLEEQAYPFEEKAIEAHAINARRTLEGVYDEWVRKSFRQLARLMPARYAKEELSAGVMASLD